MRTVLYRFNRDKNTKKPKKHLLGKIFRPAGYTHDIFYRDIYGSQTVIWKTKYSDTGEPSMTMDHHIFEFCQKAMVPEIHYFHFKKQELYTITIEKMERHVNRGNITIETMYGATQYFIPLRLFTKIDKNYPVPWIKEETSVHKLIAEKDQEIMAGQMVPVDAKLKLLDAWKKIQKKQNGKTI
jgi:hypothetical protein